VYTIYAYFNIDQIQGVLNAVVMLVGSSGVDGDYLSLIRIAGMIGLMIAVTGGMVKARGEEAGMYMVMMAIFYTTLFVPRVTVTIEDAGGGSGAPVTVDNVPVGLAFFASTTSKIGHWFTDKTETFFTLPDDTLKFSRHGLMGGVRSLREASNAAVQDPVLQSDMVSFMRDCINPELAGNVLLMPPLMASTNLLVDLGAPALINPGRMVSLVSQAAPMACDAAYANLTPRLTLAATDQAGEIARILSPNATPAIANTMFAAMLPAAEGLIMTASASAADAVRQRMMLNLMNDTSKTMAQVLNDPAAAQNAAAAAASAQSANASYVVMAKLASETLPMMRNAIELVILGIFPIVLVLIIIAGAKGGMVLRSYVLTMLWVQLWAPLYAIVNYVGMLTAAKQMTAALAGVDGVSVQNAAAFVNTAISAEAIAGILTISVPIIALAIVKGGEVAMSGMVSGMTAPAQQAASKVGGAAGIGNFGAGNVQWGNIQANNTGMNGHVQSYRGDDPSLRSVTNAGGTTVTSGALGGPLGGQIVGWQPQNFGSGAVGGKIEAAHQLSNADTSGRTVSGGWQQSAGGSTMLASVMSNDKSAQKVAELGNTLQSILGTDVSVGNMLSGGRTVIAKNDAGTNSSNRQSSGINGATTIEGGVEASRSAGKGTTSNTDNADHSPAAPKPPASPGTAVAPAAAAAAGTAGNAPAAAATAAAGNAAAAPTGAAGAPKPSRGAPGDPLITNTSKGGSQAAAGIKGKASVSATTGVEAGDGSQASATGGYAKESADKFDRAIKAVDSWANANRDGRSQMAANAIRSSLQQSKQAMLTETQSVSDTRSAGNEQRSGDSVGWSAGGAAGMAAGLAAATAFHGGNLEKAQIALSQGDPATVAAAQKGSQAAIKAGEQEREAASGLKAPLNADTLKTELKGDVATANTANRSDAQAQNKTDEAAVAAKQHANPDSKVDTAAFAANYNGVVAGNLAGLSGTSREAAVAAGVASVAKDMYNNKNDAGVGHFLRNFNNVDGFRATTATAADIEKVLGNVAAGSTSIQDGLVAAAANGGKIPDGLKHYMIQQGNASHQQLMDAKQGKE
jgi:conjugal transfer mating pair stabilization protein TraG